MTIPRRLLPTLFLALALLPGVAITKEPPVTRQIQVAKVLTRVFRVTDFGAKGDGLTMNSDAFRQAIEACAKAGGGRVVVPAGIYRTGPFELTSHMALVVEKDAVIQASDQFSDFGFPSPLPTTQPELDALRKQMRPLITGNKLEDVAILGAGIIDGAGAPWWAQSDKASERTVLAAKAARAAKTVDEKMGEAGADARAVETPLYVPRPHLVVLRDCARIHIQGVTLRNSPMFHLVPSRCSDVLIEDVTITAPADAPNTDGIDPANCRDMLIRRCTIDTGDDNIALKAGAGGGLPTENITVTDCKFLHGHGVSIGSETDTGVNHFVVQRCSFENTGTALRIKSDRTRGGLIQNITYRDITMKNVETAITIFLYYDDKKAALRPEAKAVTKATPTLRGIHFQNITCTGTTKKAGEIAGLPESPATDITLENVRITGAAGPFTLQDTRNLRFLNVDVQTIAAAMEATTTP